MRSHDSVIFSYFSDSYFSSYGEFKMREIIQIRVMLPLQLAGRRVRVRKVVHVVAQAIVAAGG